MKELTTKKSLPDSLRHLPQHYEELRMPLSFDGVFALQAREAAKTMAGYIKAYREEHGDKKGKAMAMRTLGTIWTEAFNELTEAGNIQIRESQAMDFISYALQCDNAGGMLQYHVAEIKHFFAWIGEQGKLFGKLDYFKLIDFLKSYREAREAVADDRNYDVHVQTRANEGADIQSPEALSALSNLATSWDKRARPAPDPPASPQRRVVSEEDIAGVLGLTMDELRPALARRCAFYESMPMDPEEAYETAFKEFASRANDLLKNRAS